MNFEIGKYYRRRDKQKALCVHVWPEGAAAFVLEHSRWPWAVESSGRVTEAKGVGDIIDEWVEPRKWRVVVAEDDKVFAWVGEAPPPSYTTRAIVEVTEGEGLCDTH